jgi:hypothetical protein
VISDDFRGKSWCQSGRHIREFLLSQIEGGGG